MRFAFLGANDDSLRLAAAIGASREHALVAIYDAGKRGSEFASISRARQSDDWESLLYAADADAVIVSASHDKERRAEQLRKLVQAELPLVLVFPACESIIGYELDMIRRDSMSPVVPYVPWQTHPAWLALQSLGSAAPSSGGIGKLTQITIESPGSDTSRGAVVASLARDFHRLAPLMGDVTQVGAIGAGAASEGSGPTSVHMTTAGGVVVRWALSPRADLRIECLGTAGKAELIAPLTPIGWRLTVTRHGQSESREFPPHDEGAAALDALTLHLQGRDDGAPAIAAWRATELAETALDSLERGRTIEMQPVEHSEEKTFKGLMAMGGCALLILSVVGCLLGALVDALQWQGLRAIGGRWWWLWLPVSCLVVFLLLQLIALLFAARTPNPPDAEIETPEEKPLPKK